MTQLRVGNFKKVEDSNGLGLDLSSNTPDNTTPPADVTPTTTGTPPVDVKPQEVNTPPADVTPPVDVKPKDVSTHTADVTPPVDVKPTTTTSSDSDKTITPSSDANKLELTEEAALKYLSEKLGKNLTSLEDLKEKPNPIEQDPYLKNLAEWREKTGRPIEDWIKYQKDYSKLDDLSVARELLQHEYPELTKEEIDFEINRNFVSSDSDMDDEINAKKLDLKKYASRGRQVLGELVSKLGEPSTTSLPKELQEEINFAKSIKDQMKQGQKLQEDYDKGIQSAANELSEIGLKLSDDLNINFRVSDEGKKELPKYIAEMPHWKNEDGSWNHKAVAEDGVKIKYFDQIIKLAYEQGLNSGKDELIKQAKNTTLDTRTTADGSLPNGSQGVQIEGLDQYLGNRGVKLRFGNK